MANQAAILFFRSPLERNALPERVEQFEAHASPSCRFTGEAFTGQLERNQSQRPINFADYIGTTEVVPFQS
jgi:hypothetical protein